MPMLGCPAKGSSTAGVKMRTRASPPASGGVMKVVSERFISAAISCIWRSLSPSASGKMASGLPASGRSLNTSTWIMGRLFTGQPVLPGLRAWRRSRRHRPRRPAGMRYPRPASRPLRSSTVEDTPEVGPPSRSRSQAARRAGSTCSSQAGSGPPLGFADEASNGKGQSGQRPHGGWPGRHAHAQGRHGRRRRGGGATRSTVDDPASPSHARPASGHSTAPGGGKLMPAG